LKYLLEEEKKKKRSFRASIGDALTPSFPSYYMVHLANNVFSIELPFILLERELVAIEAHLQWGFFEPQNQSSD
jgi:hypothetical protein